MSGFFFQVERRPHLGYGFDRDDHWTVHLPFTWDHGSEDGDWWITGSDMPHADAVAEVESFIADAQAALAALKERREVVRR